MSRVSTMLKLDRWVFERCFPAETMTCSFLWINESGWEFIKKKAYGGEKLINWKDIIICCRGTYWNCLIEAISMCTYNICYWKWGWKLFRLLCFPSIMSIAFTSFKHPNCQSVLEFQCHYTANCLFLHDCSFISKFQFMNLFANLQVAIVINGM